uniref:MC2B protein n=1 Tax=Aegilops speltoides TaxID=4573 RepID=G8GKN9_AEGSP|nr:metacaspase 2 [Aegilops speltoides]CCC14967.1 MC2B protein [Aegilops speltoides]
MEGETTKRLATLVGCNYVGTRYELRGCINDVDAVRDTLVARFGFAPADVAVLTDGRGAEVLPTGANIRRALADMVARAAPGDVLFFHYSGHGTLVPPRHGDSGAEEEAIVPTDFNLITDVDFRQLVDRVPPGASFTIVSDSCHSGGLIDQEKEQIGPSVGSDPGAGSTAPARTARFLPYGAILDHLSAVSGMPSSHHVGDHLVALFGADASAKFHVHGGSGNGSTLSTTPAPAPTPPRPDEGILLSGCQTNETSADVPAYEASGGKACGAFSSAVQSVLAAHPAPLSNRELVAKARAVLEEQGFEQHPCLYCTDANAEAPFLSQDKKEETAVGAASPAMSAALL